jgi:predicted DNA-binding transcriptional regulator YafY
MVDSVIRQVKVLALIPQLPASITISEVHNKIKEYGFDVSAKTIERDLSALSRFFPIIAEENRKPYRWSFSEKKTESILSISLEMALILNIVREHSQGLFPASIIDHLAPYFQQADKTLSSLTKNSLSNWRDKIHVVHDYVTFQAPTQNKTLIDKLYSAVMTEKQIVAHYCSRGGEGKEYKLEPLGIVLKGSLTYLVCRSGTHENILTFSANRFSSIMITDINISDKSQQLDVASFIKDGAFGMLRSPEKIKFVARIENLRGWHLYETPLSDDQMIVEDQEGSFLLKATVIDSQYLLWWVLSMGSRIEVVEPVSLRNDVISQMNKMVEKYR